MTLITQPKLTLDEVRSKFQQWRSTRNSSREKIPDYLWTDVINLIGSHSACEITRILGLNHTQLKTKLNEITQAELNQVGLSNPFIEVGSDSKQTPVNNSSPSRVAMPVPLDEHAGPIEIKRSDGSSLIIQALPINSIQSLIQAFIG